MPGVDAQHDFLRARRHQTLARLAARLRGEPNDVGVILPYEEVVAALGFVSEHSAGFAVVALEAIVGTMDRGREFDRSFRPTSGRVRSRWEHIAAAMRRGESMPLTTAPLRLRARARHSGRRCRHLGWLRAIHVSSAGS